MATSQTKKQIGVAFRALRASGYFARQNWKCCQSCGCAALPEGTKNYAFYHAQDAERLNKTGEVYLAWSGDGSTIVKALRDAGLRVDHDGDESRRIFVRSYAPHRVA